MSLRSSRNISDVFHWRVVCFKMLLLSLWNWFKVFFCLFFCLLQKYFFLSLKVRVCSEKDKCTKRHFLLRPCNRFNSCSRWLVDLDEKAISPFMRNAPHKKLTRVFPYHTNTLTASITRHSTLRLVKTLVLWIGLVCFNWDQNTHIYRSLEYVQDR